MSNNQSHQNYRADIDGLRAIAVLPVVFYHAGFAFFSGGFVGVDVFFVISGYLITSIIAREIESGEFRLRNFYERRARRLFPALFAMIAICCVLASALLMPWELEDFGQSVATTTLFSSNFLFFTEAGYFDGPAELKPLLHTWSLAIEEQYYLLFPAFLFLIKRKLSARFLTWTAIVFITSMVISIWSTHYAPDAAFYLLPSRTWELLLGSLLALAPTFIIHRTLREVGSLIGITLILWSALTFDATTVFPGVAAIPPCLGTALLIFCGQHGASTLTMRFLSLRPIVFVGLISYSLYLWHWPILVFAKHYLLRAPTPLEASVLISVAAIVAIASWHFVEKPFRGRRGLLNSTGVFKASLASIVVLIALGVVFDNTEGLPSRLPGNVQRIAAVAVDKPAERKRCEGIKPDKLTYERACRINSLDVQPTFAVWGDSHAMAAMPSFTRTSELAGVNGINFTSNGCVPLLGVFRPAGDLEAECRDFATTVLEILREHPEISTIVLHARWARHSEGTQHHTKDRHPLFLATDNIVASTTSENHAIYTNALHVTLVQLQALERNVVIVGAIPEASRDVPNVLAKALWHGQEIDLSIPVSEYHARQAYVKDLFASAQKEFGFVWLSPESYLCNADICGVVSETGLPLYFDDNHLASQGALRLDGLSAQAIATAL